MGPKKSIKHTSMAVAKGSASGSVVASLLKTKDYDVYGRMFHIRKVHKLNSCDLHIARGMGFHFPDILRELG